MEIEEQNYNAKLMVMDALLTDGAQHKQWYLERILEAIGYDPETLHSDLKWERGIAPEKGVDSGVMIG
jgi:hypothetical protein